MWCEKCHSVQLEIGELCDECGHVQGEITVDKDKRIAELEARIDKAKRQIAVADRYAREAKPEHDKVASVWEIQNGLIHDALSGV